MKEETKPQDEKLIKDIAFEAWQRLIKSNWRGVAGEIENAIREYKSKSQQAEVAALPDWKEKVTGIFKKHSSSYLVRYPHLYGNRIEDYKWNALIDDLAQLQQLSPVTSMGAEFAEVPIEITHFDKDKGIVTVQTISGEGFGDAVIEVRLFKQTKGGSDLHPNNR